MTAQHPELPIYPSALTPSPHNLILPSLKPHLPLQKLNPLLPIQHHTPPWLISPPLIYLDLANLPKSDNSSYRRHIRSIISTKFPNHIICLTDGSKTGPYSGYAFSIQGSVTSYRIRNFASIFTAELLAIYSGLFQLTHFPSNSKFVLLTDSLSSLQSIKDPSSNNPIVYRIHVLLLNLASSRSSISSLWIPGHIDHPEHDLVDHAAKQASFSPSISNPSLTPASNLQNFYKAKIITSWHNHWKNSSL